MATFAWQTGSFVIAEGIEDGDTLAFLRGIDDADLRAGHVIKGGQGFGLGRPSPEPTIERPALLEAAPEHSVANAYDADFARVAEPGQTRPA